ncbi:Seipin-1 [Dichanthelium oligosanthes]|uniref:Seipin-1 n=1 Tax=Dichanthelium oligosanthes TaxID=888268 RepID=A0A1E5W318_9POAL|nr:Seipin-1 [Dichanthelium oligosanthes]
MRLLLERARAGKVPFPSPGRVAATAVGGEAGGAGAARPSTWNAEGRIQCSSDISVLTPKGESQAETSRQMLISDSFDACFTSPLSRSRRTAEIIWEGRDDDLIPFSDLREIDLYSFQLFVLQQDCTLQARGYCNNLELSPSMLHSILLYSCNRLMDSAPHHLSTYPHDYSLPAAASSGKGLYTGRPRSTATGDSNDALLFLAVPAGWLIRLIAFLGEIVASAILSLVLPFAALIGTLRAVPAVVASNLRRAALGLLAAACTFVALVAALFVSALLGFVLVRHWVEEPVTVRQPLYFDYTEVQPTAGVVLGGARGVALPAGHSVRVSMALLLPDSYHNREVGVFQIKAEALSVTGLAMASATQPYMLRYKSTSVRLAQTALMCVPLTLGMRSEAQTANIKVLQYREGHGRHKRTGLIRVLLQPRATTLQLPQVYKAEVVVQTTLPWTKNLARSLKWTLCVWVSFSVYIVLVALAICWVRPLAVSARYRRLSELQGNGKMASDLGTGDIGESPSKELSEEFTVKRRERRSRRKAQFRTQSQGGSRELEFTEGSTSNVEVVETGQATNDP